MRSVMASAMRPSSTVKVSVLEMLSGERNAELIPAKIAISRISSTKGPNSGADMKRRRRDVWVKSGHRGRAAKASADRLRIVGKRYRPGDCQRRPGRPVGFYLPDITC